MTLRFLLERHVAFAVIRSALSLGLLLIADIPRPGEGIDLQSTNILTAVAGFGLSSGVGARINPRAFFQGN